MVIVSDSGSFLLVSNVDVAIFCNGNSLNLNVTETFWKQHNLNSFQSCTRFVQISKLIKSGKYN